MIDKVEFTSASLLTVFYMSRIFFFCFSIIAFFCIKYFLEYYFDFQIISLIVFLS